MAVEVGDCATVLEQFVHDAANLPAEINYMMEEIQAIDKEMQRYLSAINSRENTLQKQVKSHGSLVAHPKEQEFAAFTKKHYELCIDLQQKKISHSDKACVMLDRQLKRLDERIQQLTKYGHLDEDVTLPSVFNRRPDQKLPFDMPTGNLPLQSANASVLNSNAHRANSHIVPTIRPPQSRQVTQVAASTVPTQRSATPTTPIVPAVLGQKASQEREQSAGADSKRRKLNMSTTGINLPNNPSGLRQSSIGPGTPKAGTPTGSRAGSLPRTTGPATKKAIATGAASAPKKGTAAHQQVTKLKKHVKHARLSQSGRKKAGSPAVRGARGGTEASEDSVLSSAEASDTDNSQAKRRRKKQAHEPEPPSASEEEGEDETDDKLYCYCNQRSFGEMVGCENPNCKREWFHISCLNLKTAPQEDHWYCPECRAEEGVSGNKKRK